MRRPQIGIPLTLDDQGRWREGRDYLYIDRRYAFAIDRAGGVPLQLPIQSDPEHVVAGLDGLLLPGGDDFPADRALPEGVELDPTPAAQLAFDCALFEAASRRGIPILGICYGMQLMAHHRGGALEPHLPSAGIGAEDHRLGATGRHRIEIETESLLASAVGAGAKEVNSLHHQAVQEPGRGQHVVARSPDGVIEAIESVFHAGGRVEDQDHGDGRPDDFRWEMGVQWHPEKMNDETSSRLFRAFVDACHDMRDRRTGGSVGAERD